MDNPFIAGFQTGLEIQRMENERKYKEALLSRMQREGEYKDYEFQKTKAADKAPEDFLRSLSTTKEGEVPAATPSESEAADIVSGKIEKSPRDILSQYTALPETQQVPLTASDRLARLNMAIAKYPEKAQVLGTLAVNDPVLGPALKLKALQEKMAEKNMEWGFKQREKVFDTDQDIRKENVKAGNELNKTITSEAIKYQSKINEKNVVLVSDPNNPEMKLPYDTNTNQPMAIIKPIDPADPKKGSVLAPNPAYNRQGDSWKLTPETAKAIIKANPDLVTSKSGKVPATEQEYDAVAKNIADNPAFASDLMQRYQQKFSPVLQGGQGQGTPTLQASASGQMSPSSTAETDGGLLDTALGLVKSGASYLTNVARGSAEAGNDPSKEPWDRLRERIIRGEGVPLQPDQPYRPHQPVMESAKSGLKSLVDMTRSAPGFKEGFSEGMFPSEISRDSPREKLQAGGVTVWASSTTLTKARGLLEKIFPELSVSQIQRILEPVRGKGEFSESVDMEKLRRDIDELYALAVKSK